MPRSKLFVLVLMFIISKDPCTAQLISARKAFSWSILHSLISLHVFSVIQLSLLFLFLHRNPMYWNWHPTTFPAENAHLISNLSSSAWENHLVHVNKQLQSFPSFLRQKIAAYVKPSFCKQADLMSVVLTFQCLLAVIAKQFLRPPFPTSGLSTGIQNSSSNPRTTCLALI